MRCTYCRRVASNLFSCALCVPLSEKIIGISPHRKTISGLLKLIHPTGEASREELQELLQLAMEGRRRVKEQLKKMGSFEFFQTSFSYIDKDSGEERYVGVPEEGGRNSISADPLEPGSVYAASVDDQGKVGLYRLEVGCASGTGKLKLAGGIDGPMKESIQRAFGYLQANKTRIGIAREFDLTDFHVEAIDLLQNRVPCEAGMGLIVAIYSALKKVPVLPAMVVFGDLSIQGNIKGVRSLIEPSQLAMENGARKALIPMENRRQFLDLSGDVAERVDPVFYGDPVTGAHKALGMT
jgi:ATP-dependent Lon protease